MKLFYFIKTKNNKLHYNPLTQYLLFKNQNLFKKGIKYHFRFLKFQKFQFMKVKIVNINPKLVPTFFLTKIVCVT